MFMFSEGITVCRNFTIILLQANFEMVYTQHKMMAYCELDISDCHHMSPQLVCVTWLVWLPTTLVVQVEHLVRCVCMSVYGCSCGLKLLN